MPKKVAKGRVFPMPGSEKLPLTNWNKVQELQACLDFAIRFGDYFILRGWVHSGNGRISKITFKAGEHLLEVNHHSVEIRDDVRSELRLPYYVSDAEIGFVKIASFSNRKNKFDLVQMDVVSVDEDGHLTEVSVGCKIESCKLRSDLVVGWAEAGCLDHKKIGDICESLTTEQSINVVRALLSREKHSLAKLLLASIRDSRALSARMQSEVTELLFAALVRATTMAGPDYADKEEVDALVRLVVEEQAYRRLSKENTVSAIGALYRLHREKEMCQTAVVGLTQYKADPSFAASIAGYISPPELQEYIGTLVANVSVPSDVKANVVNALGASLRLGDKIHLSEAVYSLASYFAEPGQVSEVNLGWLSIEGGDFPRAMERFRNVQRIYPQSTTAVQWPEFSGAKWPIGVPHYDYSTLPVWPRISVVTPSYNQGQFIEETILSVVNQRYPNLQYIVVDGDSSDSTYSVLQKYKDVIDVLIIEPDNGQTEAINKGLRLSDGDLVCWLNSDDMFCPGALWGVAIAYMRTQADVIAGICVEHSDHRQLLYNLPLATQEDFNVGKLADIFTYWLRGHFFYQPEVIFSRKILEKIGGELDESLYYSMDYDLWMKFAAGGAKLERLPWPVAFFRKHDGQKTRALIDCIEEQCVVRERHHLLAPSFIRNYEIDQKLRRFQSLHRPRVCVVSSRIDKIFSHDISSDLTKEFGGEFDISFTGNAFSQESVESDALIYLVHLQNDVHNLKSLREQRPERATIGWFWDNHHHPFENYGVAEQVDFVSAGHGGYSKYLRNRHGRHIPSVPLCTTQWSKAEASRFFEQSLEKVRSSALWGGFVKYAFAEQRNAFIQSAMSRIKSNALYFLDETETSSYFAKSPEARFFEWCGYKVSLVVPLHNDLSQRVFDALLTGQVPIVPIEIADLYNAFSSQEIESLPIVTFSLKDPESLARAYKYAVAQFDDKGIEGMKMRHDAAINHHMFSSRVNTFLEILKGVSPVGM